MTIKDIKVHTVSTDKLIEFIDFKLPENDKLHIDSFAIYKDLFGINTDCMFWDLNDATINNEIQAVINIECRIKKHIGEGRYSIRMDKVDFIHTISLADYLKMATEVSLVDFIRFNYNPRIEGNQRLLMKYIKEAANG